MFAPASTGVRQPSPAIEHSGPFRCGCSHRRAFDLSSCTPRAHREFWLLAMSLLAQLQVRQLEALIEITFFSRSLRFRKVRRRASDTISGFIYLVQIT